MKSSAKVGGVSVDYNDDGSGRFKVTCGAPSYESCSYLEREEFRLLLSSMQAMLEFSNSLAR